MSSPKPPDDHKVREQTREWDTLLTAMDLAEIYCLSVREIYRKAASGEIPKPIKLGHHTTRWRASAIQAHIDSLNPRE
jgi:predicted DNA-binding transcriptional regulator AlpA